MDNLYITNVLFAVYLFVLFYDIDLSSSSELLSPNISSD